LIDTVCQCVSEGLNGDEGSDRKISELHFSCESKSQSKAKVIIGSSVFINSTFGPESEVEIHFWTKSPFPAGFKGVAIFIQDIVCFLCVLSLIEKGNMCVFGKAVLKSALNVCEIGTHERQFFVSEFMCENKRKLRFKGDM